MQISTEVIFEFLKRDFTEEQIFQMAEFSRERFFVNLENEKNGLINKRSLNSIIVCCLLFGKTIFINLMNLVGDRE